MKLSIARVLSAMVPIAMIFALLVSRTAPGRPSIEIGTPLWFLGLHEGLVIVWLVTLLGAAIGILWRGEEGFILGTFAALLGGATTLSIFMMRFV